MMHGERTLRLLLEPLVRAGLNDPATTDVVVNRPGETGVAQRAGWRWFDAPELTFDRLDAIGILAGFMGSKDVDPAHPICGSTLPDGQRIHICRPPATHPGVFSLSIRKPSNETHHVTDPDFGDLFTDTNAGANAGEKHDAELIRLFHSKEWDKFFSLAVKAGKNIVATGATGSGKTSVLRRFLHEIPLPERVVSIEDTDEFGVLPHRNRVALFYGSAGVTASDAVEASLRMAPSRIIMQELRGGEAYAYMRNLASGHRGGMTTWHCERPSRENPTHFVALEQMIKQTEAGRAIPDDRLRERIRQFHDVVLWCSRDGGRFQIPYVWFRAAEDQAERAAA